MSKGRRLSRNVKITSVGCYVPPKMLTNADLEKMVETNDEWIVSRTGIRSRHIAGDDMATSDLAVEAARIALEKRDLTADEVETIIVCTVTPDMLFPSTACLVQDRLGAKHAWGFDLVAACSGLLYGLTTGCQLIASGSQERVLVIGADTMSRIVDYKDRATCVLFGDGAGAMLLEPADGENVGLLDFYHEVDGSGGHFLYMPAGGSRLPATFETGRKARALCPPGRPECFPLRGAEDVRDLHHFARAQRLHARRRGRDDPPSGQCPHHQRGVGAAGDSPRKGHH